MSTISVFFYVFTKSMNITLMSSFEHREFPEMLLVFLLHVQSYGIINAYQSALGNVVRLLFIVLNIVKFTDYHLGCDPLLTILIP